MSLILARHIFGMNSGVIDITVTLTIRPCHRVDKALQACKGMLENVGNHSDAYNSPNNANVILIGPFDMD